MVILSSFFAGLFSCDVEIINKGNLLGEEIIYTNKSKQFMSTMLKGQVDKKGFYKTLDYRLKHDYTGLKVNSC
jgi:hypothetical protein